jgi:hypothetical protein
MDMKRHNFKIENKNDELLGTIWEYKTEKKKMGKGGGQDFAQFGILPFGQRYTFIYIHLLFNLIKF